MVSTYIALVIVGWFVWLVIAGSIYTLFCDKEKYDTFTWENATIRDMLLTTCIVPPILPIILVDYMADRGKEIARKHRVSRRNKVKKETKLTKILNYKPFAKK